MTEEKRCWMCRRTEAEVNKELDEFLCEEGIEEDNAICKLNQTEANTTSKEIWICHGCYHIVMSLTRHSIRDDFYSQPLDIVLFDDLEKIVVKSQLFMQSQMKSDAIVYD